MRCVIISGSPETNPNFLKQAVKPDDYVICADRGYEFAILAGIEPNLIVGDFDSYKEKISASCEIVKLNPHKDDTDTIHSIDLAFEQGFTDFLLLVQHDNLNIIADKRLDLLISKDSFCFTFINSGSRYVNVVETGNSFYYLSLHRYSIAC